MKPASHKGTMWKKILGVVQPGGVYQFGSHDVFIYPPNDERVAAQTKWLLIRGKQTIGAYPTLSAAKRALPDMLFTGYPAQARKNNPIKGIGDGRFSIWSGVRSIGGVVHKGFNLQFLNEHVGWFPTRKEAISAANLFISHRMADLGDIVERKKNPVEKDKLFSVMTDSELESWVDGAHRRKEYDSYYERAIAEMSYRESAHDRKKRAGLNTRKKNPVEKIWNVYSGHGKRMNDSPFYTDYDARSYADSCGVDFPEDWFHVVDELADIAPVKGRKKNPAGRPSLFDKLNPPKKFLAEPKHTFVKIMFYGSGGETAGIVMPMAKVRGKTVSQLSRFFPYSEAPKMEKIYISDEFDTWEKAFAHKPELP